MLTSACSIIEEKDIQFIRQNLDAYHTETIPYKEEITFTLPTEKILNGIVEPIKITSIHDTDVFVIETYEKENPFTKNKEIDIIIGFDSHVNSKNGTVLSHFRLNDDGTYTTGDVFHRVFDENGELGNFGRGSGDHEGRFEQFVSFTFEQEELKKSRELTFEISGLYQLNYTEK